MDRPPVNPLRARFISSANALTSLYKEAARAEGAGRAAGERAAYLAVLEWAARRSRAGLAVGPGDIATFASERLAVGGAGQVPEVAAADVAEQIGEMRVAARPRKRTRVDIGDAFLEMWGDEDEEDDEGERRAMSDETAAVRKAAAMKKGPGKGRRRE